MEILAWAIQNHPYYVMFFAVAPGVVGFAGMVIGYVKGAE
jgi:hypothetical protein